MLHLFHFGKLLTKSDDFFLQLIIYLLITINSIQGTTGKPKGVKLSHFSLINVNRILGSRQNIDIDNEIKICSVLPFYFIYGMTVGGFYMATFGCTLGNYC